MLQREMDAIALCTIIITSKNHSFHLGSFLAFSQSEGKKGISYSLGEIWISQEKKSVYAIKKENNRE